jgi:hypothetical protein
MKDFSDWKEYEGTSEGSGRSEKIWLKNPNTGETGLFNYNLERVIKCLLKMVEIIYILYGNVSLQGATIL